MNPELKVPPVIVVLSVALLMWLTTILLSSLSVTIPYNGLAAIITMILGFAVTASGVTEFQKSGNNDKSDGA